MKVSPASFFVFQASVSRYASLGLLFSALRRPKTQNGSCLFCFFSSPSPIFPVLFQFASRGFFLFYASPFSPPRSRSKMHQVYVSRSVSRRNYVPSRHISFPFVSPPTLSVQLRSIYPRGTAGSAMHARLQAQPLWRVTIGS